MEVPPKTVQFLAEKCIICQEKDDAPLCVPTEQGKNTLKRASDIRDDPVSKRLKHAEESGVDYVYHNVNKCFKAYVKKG